MLKNPFFDGTSANGPEYMDWNARYSATERTYMYRILHSRIESGFGTAFEWDRSLRITDPEELNVEAMSEAARLLKGTRDFSAFRGNGCEQSSPVLQINDVSVTAQPYEMMMGLGMKSLDRPNLLSIKVCGKRFLYRQVRNMVGCLLEVGRENLSPSDVHRLMEDKDRSKAPAMAPAHGLFLADVKHGEFRL